jgi:tRNA-splicing ligase RtcB
VIEREVRDGVPLKLWTEGVPVEAAALDQLFNVARLPFVGPHVAVMPDVHFGIGATVGSVIPTRGAIIPAALGVDIGCGLLASRLSISASDLPDSLRETRLAIEKLVPVGFADHGDNVPRSAESRWYQRLKRGLEDIQQKHPKIGERKSPARQLGTLGGGNHFIEVCLDEEQRVWVMLHSGSRGVGNQIGTFFIGRAKEWLVRRGIKLVDANLAWLEEAGESRQDFLDYVEAVEWAQDYAAENRKVMMELTLKALRQHLPEFSLTGTVVACHHNFVSLEEHRGEQLYVTRKGAVSARAGQFGIIPGSMGTRSYIVRGLGNVESFHSCSHGAGRRMSRGEAKRTLKIEDHIAATDGVECRKDIGVLDESPAAYKNVEAILAAQTDLVEVVHTLKQVLCVKG